MILRSLTIASSSSGFRKETGAGLVIAITDVCLAHTPTKTDRKDAGADAN